MLIEKQLEIGLDVHDMFSLYIDDGNVKRIIEQRYVGRCFRECLIQSVDRIIRTGECIISQENLPTYGTMAAHIAVTGIVFEENEVITGCVVEGIADGIIICSTPQADIALSATKLLESLTVGQIISVRVRMSRYSQNSEKISVTAFPYLPIHKSLMFRVPIERPAISAEQIAAWNAKLDDIEARYQALRAENPKAIESIEQLIYAYHEPQKPPKTAEVLEIRELVHGTSSAFLTRDQSYRQSISQVYGFNENPENEKYILCDRPWDDIVRYMIDDYYNSLRVVCEMVEIYSVDGNVAKHRNLWQIYKKAKV